MNSMAGIQTLHCHTTNSDGQLTHLEVLKVCEQNGISVVAFTDHDALLTHDDVEKLRTYKGPVKWISGVEISSGFSKEPGSKVKSLHIVGLFVDPTYPSLLEHCKKAQEARIVRMQQMVGSLQKLGFDITEEACLKASGGEAVGRPHIVKALNSKESNTQVMDGLRLQMEKAAANDSEVRKAYDAMMLVGESQYPYVLFLKENSFIPGVYVDYLYRLDTESSVKLIRDAGGLAILAHYFTYTTLLSPEALDRLFEENVFDGAEVVYGLETYDPDSPEESETEASSRVVEELVSKHGKFRCGGVDAHSEKDFVTFANSGDFADRTIGMVEEIIQKSRISTKWSNFP